MSVQAIPLQPAPAASDFLEDQYGRIAQEVAALLSPTITAAVDRAVIAGIDQLRSEIREKEERLSEAERCISDLEEEAQSTQAAALQTSQTQQYILEKLDLENRSCQNNLHIIGLPESFNSDSLSELCTRRIPLALGITNPCIVERAHRVVAPSNDRRSPCPVIVRYLNYSDRVAILKSFGNANLFQLEGHKLLISADYSLGSISQKKGIFNPFVQPSTSKDLNSRWPTRLFYGSQTSQGKPSPFHIQRKLPPTSYLKSHLHITQELTPMETSRYPEGSQDQRSLRKDPPKRFCYSDNPGLTKHH